MSKQKGSSVMSNVIWRLAENGGAQLVTLIVSIVLARILDPDVYGLIALVYVFIVILLVFVNQGLGNALVQKKNADHLDFSTVFWTSMVLCPLLYLLVFFTAPLLAWFFENPEITPLFRVLGLILIIAGVKNIEEAYISRNMMFKKFFFATLVGTIISAVVGIWMALAGFGVWALVAQSLTNPLIDTIILWFSIDWRPKLEFSKERLKGLFSYGGKLLLSALIDKLYINLRALIIGKKYTSADLAFYNKGENWPKLFTDTVNNSIDSVLLPVMSQAQTNKEEVKRLTRRAIKTSTFVIIPFLAGLFAVATPFIAVLLKDKWVPCVPYLRLFCLTFMLYPLHTANLNAIKAVGKSGTYLKLEIIKEVVGVAILLIAMQFGLMWLAISVLISDIVGTFINAYPNRKFIDYKLHEQIRDAAPAFLISAVMCVAVYCVKFLGLSNILSLVVQVPLGIVIYVLLAVIFKLEAFSFFMDKLKAKLPFGKKSKE